MKRVMLGALIILFACVGFAYAQETDSCDVVVTVTAAMEIDIQETSVSYDFLSTDSGVDSTQTLTIDMAAQIPCDVYMSAPSNGDPAWAAFITQLSGLHVDLLSSTDPTYDVTNVGLLMDGPAASVGLHIKDVTAGPYANTDVWELDFPMHEWIAVNGSDDGTGSIEVAMVAK